MDEGVQALEEGPESDSLPGDSMYADPSLACAEVQNWRRRSAKAAMTVPLNQGLTNSLVGHQQ